ncbi:hypothetical protein [Granulicella arctica]|uniref:hypothetical protein n=1 Tax=Granulicella arctica TaxID=940613 RepID=UPI0021DF9BBE|nr:hypothetical protein [Granulicella arctica]
MRDKIMQDEESEKVEERLIRALEARPMVQIPADFAARVLQQLPRERPVILARTNYGRLVMMICMVVLGVSLPLMVALHGIANAPVLRVTEWLLYVQFLGLVLWFGMRGEVRNVS